MSAAELAVIGAEVARYQDIAHTFCETGQRPEEGVNVELTAAVVANFEREEGRFGSRLFVASSTDVLELLLQYIQVGAVLAQRIASGEIVLPQGGDDGTSEGQADPGDEA